MPCMSVCVETLNTVICVWLLIFFDCFIFSVGWLSFFMFIKIIEISMWRFQSALWSCFLCCMLWAVAVLWCGAGPLSALNLSSHRHTLALTQSLQNVLLCAITFWLHRMKCESSSVCICISVRWLKATGDIMSFLSYRFLFLSHSKKCWALIVFF